MRLMTGILLRRCRQHAADVVTIEHHHMLSAGMFLPLGAMHALQWAAGDVVRPRPGVEFLRNEGPDGSVS